MGIVIFYFYRCILLLFCIFSTFSAWSMHPPEEVNVVTEDFPPYNYIENGLDKGLATEVVNKIFEKIGVRFNRVEYPWPRAYYIALNMPNTLIYSLTRTEDRELLFKWAGKVVDTNVNVYSLNSRQDIVINSLKDLDGYTIGVMRDDITHIYLEKIGIKENLHLVSDERLNIKKLIADRVDLIVYDEYGFNHAINKLGYDQSSFRKVHTLTEISKPLYMAFSLKTDDKLVEAFTKALDELKQEGLYENIFKVN